MYIWEVRKQKLFGEDTCPSHHQCQTLAGDEGPVRLGVGGSGFILVRWVAKLQVKGKLGKFHVYSGNVHASDCGSAHCSGCVVNGISANEERMLSIK